MGWVDWLAGHYATPNQSGRKVSLVQREALCKGLIINKLTQKSSKNHHNAGRWNENKNKAALFEAMKFISYTSISFFIILFSCSDKNKIIPINALLLKREIEIERSGITSGKILKEYKYIDTKISEIRVNETLIYATGTSGTAITNYTIEEYKYSNHSLISKTIKSEKGEILEIHEFEYNSKNQLIKEYISDADRTIKRMPFSYTYNLDGTLATKTWYKIYEYPYNVFNFVIKYEYQTNNVIKESYFDINDVLFGELLKYYDGKKKPFEAPDEISSQNGNLIKMTGTEKYKPIDGFLAFTKPKQNIWSVAVNTQDKDYVFNDMGYPTKQRTVFNNNNRIDTFGFEYY